MIVCKVCGEPSVSSGSLAGHVHKYGPAEHGAFEPTELRFRDLAIGAAFEFDRGGNAWWSHSLPSGPWRKVSTRCYVDAVGGIRCQVGSINVNVSRVEA